MQATVNLPDSLYERSAALAAARGATVEQIIVDALAKTIDEALSPGDAGNADLPLIRSARPGTLDLSRFDFDDLLT